MTGELPQEHFEARRSLAGRVSLQQIRELQRKVGSDARVEVDTNAYYGVPRHLIGSPVTVQVYGSRVEIFYACERVAEPSGSPSTPG